MSTVPPVSRTLSHSGIESVFEIRTTHSTRPQGNNEPQAQLLILSRNPELVDVVCNAARSVAQVAQARDLDDAARTLAHVDPGVLLLDDAIIDDVSAAITQVTRRYPEAVLVIVGTRDESSELMQLAAAGRVFRFLLMPLSFGPVRLALAAAVTHHTERKAAGRRIASVPPDASHSGRKRALIYVALAATLLITIGGLWRVSGMLTSKPTAAVPVATVAPTTQAPKGVMTLEANPLLAQLQRATEAMAQGHYVEPAGGSALELYRSVLQADPNSEAARDGIRAIADEYMLRAEQAVVAESIEDAQRLLTLVRSIDADHPRLAFLDSSLARERDVRNLSERRDMGNRVRQLVETARSAMSAGDFIGSGGAASALAAARKLDPANPAVVQNVRDLTTALEDAVRVALDTGDMTRAQAFATAANKLGGGEQLTAMVQRAVADAKRAALPPAIAAPAVQTAPPVIERAEPQPVASAGVPTVETGGVSEVLQAASLPRIKEIMPTYPPMAAARNIEGYVDLEFTIASDGVPRNFNVLSSTPKRMFDNAAVSCIRQWRFAPIMQNGMSVARRATLRVRFELQ